MSPLIPDNDANKTQVDAGLEAYRLAQEDTNVAQEVLEWMTWHAIEMLQRGRVSSPKEIAARLGIRQLDVIKRMMPPVQARFYSKELSPAAQTRVDEILRQAGGDS